MNVGEWVLAENQVGFIVFKNHTETSIKVKFGYRNSKVYSKDDISPVKFQLDNDAIHNLQLLALETNDKIWFEELGRLKTRCIV
ncbi:hypothetical protein [Bacillus sp. FSL L8-0152]